MMGTRVLVTEDSLDLQEEILDYLRAQGYEAEGAASLASMNEKLLTGQFHLLLLDLGLPDGDGLDAIADLRKHHGLELGIVLVSARGQPEERARGLKEGADSYLVKPVFLPELMALLERLTLRVRPTAAHYWRLDIRDHLLICPEGKSVELTGSEFLLLSQLSGSSDPQTRESLCAMLRDKPISGHEDTRKLDTLFSRLRSKIEHSTGKESPIRTYRNRGYGLSEQLREMKAE